MNKYILQTIDVAKKYDNLSVLSNINIAVTHGEVVAITGSSGVGKTTLLNILSSLDTHYTGKIFIDGIDISLLNSSSLCTFRNQNIGIVFQYHNLLPEFSALENIAMPAYISGLSKQDSDIKALNLMELLNIADCRTKTPAQLSGGQAQRVAVARALINSPKIVFADEPSGSLDDENASQLHNLIFSLRDTLSQSFVISTHSKVLSSMSDRIIILENGMLL